MTVTVLDVPRAKLSPDEKITINRLARWYRQSLARAILPNERVAKCYRVRTKELVDVLRSVKYKRAHYGGLMTCGSVWQCPVCAAKITERRRNELQQAINNATTKGYSFFLATFTLQHTRADTLKDVRTYLTDALEQTKSGRWWGDFTKKFEIIGNIAKSEVTYSMEHGWHFHKHLLFITCQPMNASKCASIKSALSTRYENKLALVGRYAHPIHGVDVRVGDTYVADYISKYGHEPPPAWSLAAEVSKSFSKTAKADGHYTPFQLLDFEDTKNLFVEYAMTMKKYNQLRWSNKLRKKLGLGAEISDEELAAMQDDDATLFAQLTIEQWKKIIKKEVRGHILEVASLGDVELFQTYLEHL